MTTLEIHAKQAELAQRIQNIDSEEILNKISDTITSLTKKKTALPSAPSQEELIARARRAVTALNNGEMDKFIPHEELKKKRIP